MNIPKMRAVDFTAEQFRAAALKCPIKLNEGKGPVRVDVTTGRWFAYPAKTELTKRYWKLCKQDLLTRQLRGGSYDGDVGTCVIGGKRFGFYPKSGMLVREDFALWCEAHYAEFWDAGRKREALPEEPSGPAITIDPQLKIWKDIRNRALALWPVTGIMRESSFNSMYDMEHALAEYSIEMQRDAKAKRFYVSTKILADQLAATIAFRQKHYSDAMRFYMDCAAAALKAALWIQEQYGEGAGKEDK